MRYSSVLFPVALIIGAMALAACGGGGSEDESSQADFGVEPEERIEEPQVAGVAEEPGAADVQAEAAREEAEARAEAQAEAQAVAQTEAEPPPVEDLRAAVLAGLRVFEEVTILEIDPLGLPDAGTLRAVHATGMGFSLGPDGGAPEAHFLAIYRAEAASTSSGRAAWQQVARLELESLPDFLVEDAVRQVEIAPGEVWFEVQGFTGAHSGVYELISYDGTALETRLTWFSPSPGAGELSDLDEDGRPEVLLNATEPFVFCYACGVWIPFVVVYRWDGADLMRVEIEALPASAPAEARAAVDRALASVRADLWRDALAAIEVAEQTGYADETLKWNAILIRTITESRLESIEQGAYPLLGYVFAGEYAEAVDFLGQYAPEEIFNFEGPLIAGTAAQSWVNVLGGWLVNFASRAVTAQPDLASAHFLLGLGEYFLDPGNGAVIRASVEQAHLLELADVLYALSVVYLLE